MTAEKKNLVPFLTKSSADTNPLTVRDFFLADRFPFSVGWFQNPNEKTRASGYNHFRYWCVFVTLMVDSQTDVILI